MKKKDRVSELTIVTENGVSEEEKGGKKKKGEEEREVRESHEKEEC